MREGLGSWGGGEGLEHSGSLREEMATEQWESTVMSTPVTMTLAPPPHPGLYERDEGATFCLRGPLQSGSICHE